MEAMKYIIGVILGAMILYIFIVWIIAKVQLAKKEKDDKLAAEILEAELKELAKWGVTPDQVYIIGGKMTMSIYAMITLANNPDYIHHLRQESLALHLHQDFFIEQLLWRIEKAKQRIQDRIDRMREKGKQFEVTDKLQEIGIK